jgi:hypothetical protein
VLCASVFLLLGAAQVPGPASAATESDNSYYGAREGSSFVVVGERRGRTTSEAGEKPAVAVTYTFKRMPGTVCGSLDGAGTSPTTCVDGTGSFETVRTCEDGSTAVDPLFRRPTDPATGLFTGPWEQVDDGGCPEDPPVTVTVSAEDFRRLPLTPSTPSFQPADGRGLVNMPLIVFTDPAPQTLATTVLDVPVTVRATPVRYAWDFGDGEPPLVTEDPGQPYPDHTVSRAYGSPGAYAVRLVTTWRGEFQVAGTGPWIPVDGTATTASPPFTTTVEEAVPRLVADP